MQFNKKLKFYTTFADRRVQKLTKSRPKTTRMEPITSVAGIAECDFVNSILYVLQTMAIQDPIFAMMALDVDFLQPNPEY